jgi:hypothetical protein
MVELLLEASLLEVEPGPTRVLQSPKPGPRLDPPNVSSAVRAARPHETLRALPRDRGAAIAGEP